MNRLPLRPLTRILKARAEGSDPDDIERENKRLRHMQMQLRSRDKAEGRMLLMGLVFLCGFSIIALRMGVVATSAPSEPRRTTQSAAINSARADIVDRNGQVLATNFETHAVFAQPHKMIDPLAAAQGLVTVFPDLDYDRLVKDFTGSKKFLWLKTKISPEQMQAVHDLGEPGLVFAPREMRLYPNGHLASHVLGGTRFGDQGATSAEIIGIAGVEKFLDERLSDPTQSDRPIVLSLDLSVQSAVERVLADGMRTTTAKGATAILMEVNSGEVISVVSLPDFDPNNRPAPALTGDQSESPLFNRSIQGLYELGSVFKIFTAAQAVDLGLVRADTMIDTSGPMKVGGFKIGEYRNKNYGTLSATDVIVKSSNRGTGRMVLDIGIQRQKEFLESLGLFEATPVEVIEAAGAKPSFPKNWGKLSSVTISYGHGISVSPMHLAAGYSAIANGGYAVRPTLLKQSYVEQGPRVLKAESARIARGMLRKVVSKGTASMGEVEGYAVGGKTGTADKPNPQGSYYKDKVIATFASLFPAHDPKYVLVVTLDEPVDRTGEKPRRTAGWTAVPVAARIIERVAPLLGLRPDVEPATLADITLASSN